MKLPMTSVLPGGIPSLMVLVLSVLFVIDDAGAQSIRDIVIEERFDNVPLKKVISTLEKKYKIEFIYLSSTISGVRVTSSSGRYALEKFLTQLLKETPVRHRILSERLLLFRESNPASGEDSARRVTISGFVSDGSSGERLSAANIYLPQIERGNASNTYGFYSVSFSTTLDSVVVSYSYVGYRTEQRWISTRRDTTLNMSLVPFAELSMVEVVGNPEESIERKTMMSRINISSEQVGSMPALLGEPDMMKTLQLLPGVHAGNEGLGGLNVRGSSPDQNLILLDGVTVYNAKHIFGFVSVFNNNAVRNIEFVKGGFPARYGGRLASVIDIDMKEGDMNRFGGSASVGMIASQLTLEGPISRDKTSFIISGRRSYADLLARPFLDEDTDLGYYFYDINAKINHRFSEKHRVFLSSYIGKDRFYRNEENFRETLEPVSDTDSTITTAGFTKSSAGLDWGNITSSLRWNALLTNRLFSNLTLTYSRYGFNFDLDNDSFDETLIRNGSGEVVDSTGVKELNEVRFGSGIRDWSARVDFDYFPSISHSFKFGVQGFLHRFSPQTVELVQLQQRDVSIDTTLGAVQDIDAREAAAWLEDTWQLSENFSINAGIHASGFWVEENFFYDIQPRISLRYLFPGQWTLKASYASTKQYIHLLTNNTTALPTDLWLPSTDKIRPEIARQVAVGFRKPIGENFELTAESYYKWMDNLISYKEGIQSLTIDRNFETKLESGGRGEAIGLELMLEKPEGRLNGFMAYTLSKSTRTFKNINLGETFPFKYDRRHNFSVSGFYDLKEHIKFSASWIYYTGQAVTIQDTKYIGIDDMSGPPDFDEVFGTREFIGTYRERNSVRMRPTHRLDFGIHFRKRNDWGLRTWTVGLYNVYGRRNPFFLFTDKVLDGTVEGSGGSTVSRTRDVVKEVSLFRVLPLITYKIDF